MNLRFSKLSGCDLNVKYRWISLKRNSWRPQVSLNRQKIVVACIHSPWKTKRRLMKFHVIVVQLRVHSVEFLVLLRFTFLVPVIGAENTKNLPLALHAGDKFWVDSWARLSTYEHFYLLWWLSCQEKTSISKWESTCQARDIFIYLWYQESGLSYVGQGMITGRQVFLYYLSRKRLDWKQCMVGGWSVLTSIIWLEWLLNQ